MTEMDNASYGYYEVEYSWRTIDVIRVSGTPYAYQQRVSVRLYDGSMHKDRRGAFNSNNRDADGATRVEEDKHRLVPIQETMDDDALSDVVDAHGDA